MSAVLSVIAIDAAGTKRIEDGVYIDPTTKELFVVSVIPDISKSYINKIELALREQRPKKKGGAYFFDPKELGIGRETPSKVFVYRSLPPYEVASLSLGKACVVKAYSFEEFDNEKEDQQAKLLREYADSQGLFEASASAIVLFLIQQLNDVAQAAMSKKGIPFLSHHLGRISTCAGRPTINRPYRDAVSFINIQQLDEWLRTGEIFFSFKQLEHFIQPET